MKRMGLIFFSLLLVFLFVTGDAPSRGRAEGLFDMIERLQGLPSFDHASIEKALSVKFATRDEANPYWTFYEATLTNGPVLSIETSEPLEGATAKERSVVLNVSPYVRVTLDDVEKRYGRGQIEQIIPNAAPEGLVSYSFSTANGPIVFSFTAKTHKARQVVMDKAK